MRTYNLKTLGASMAGLALGLSLLATPALARGGGNFQGGGGGFHGGGGGFHGGGGGWQSNGGAWHTGGGGWQGQQAYHGNNWGGGYNNGYGYGYNDGNWVAPAVGLGLLGGAIAGSAYAEDNGYGVQYDAPPAGGDPTAYCLSRFKSYNPATGTYLGYDGLRHPCP